MTRSLDRQDGTSTAAHIERILRQQEKLRSALVDSFEQLCAELSREQLSMIEKVNWWQWARDFEIPGSSTKICAAMNTNPSSLARWLRCPSDDPQGTFPLSEFMEMPRKGVHCVYLLIDSENNVVYIGKSSSMRQRLKTHWKSDKRPYLAQWQVFVCDTKHDQSRLEADLIFHHKPRFNKVGAKSRIFHP